MGVVIRHEVMAITALRLSWQLDVRSSYACSVTEKLW